MDSAIVPRVTRSGRPALAVRIRRWPSGSGLAGTLVVLVTGVFMTVVHTARYMATEPFEEWFPGFLFMLQVNLLRNLAILLAVVWVRKRWQSRGAAQYAAAAAAVVVAAVVGGLALRLYEAWENDEPFTLLTNPDWSPARHLIYFGAEAFAFAVIGVIIASAWLYLRTEAEHAAAADHCAIDAERMDRQAAEARLQVLEAQIEPHFLFNTLAHVKRLYETDHAAGARMLHNLADYLAGALPQMRAASTLGRELAHVTAYLNIQQIRMGRRLAFAIDVPEALREVEVPPLMVLTLVENAIKHGLSPLPQGGRIDVRASVADGPLRIQVADTGQGFTKSSGGGTGLANTRARLASKYGPGASLSLALNEPSGVVATISFPHEAATAGALR